MLFSQRLDVDSCCVSVLAGKIASDAGAYGHKLGTKIVGPRRCYLNTGNLASRRKTSNLLAAGSIPAEGAVKKGRTSCELCSDLWEN